MNTDALEQAARAATPGPWDQLLGLRTVCGTVGGGGVLVALAVDDEDAAYVAAASPDVILRLIAAAREADALREVPIDVTLLAEALNATVGTVGWARMTPSDPVEEWLMNAAIVAEKYVALSATGPAKGAK